MVSLPVGDEDSDIDQPRGMVGGRNLPVAIGVGLALAAVFLGSLFWDGRAFVAVVALLTVIAYVESAGVLRPLGIRLGVPVLVVATLVMLVGAYVAGHEGQAGGVILLFLGAFVWTLLDARRSDVVRGLGSTLLFGLWIGFLASYAALLVTRDPGPLFVLAVIGAAAVADIGAYAVGVSVGRHALAPSISPNKSWEGLIGGLVVAGVAGALVLPALGDEFTPLTAAVLAVICGLASAVGDLAESVVKRDLGVKDLGGVLPGHGGVLDRVDGILFALPVGYHLLAVLV